MPQFLISLSALRRCCSVFAAALAAILLAAIWPAMMNAEAACGQTDAPQLSADAQAILSINQTFSAMRGQAAQIAGAPAASARGGEAASLQQRALLVRQLMQAHPEEVRSVMLPASVAARLVAADPANANLLEHDAAAEGDLSAVQMDDFEQGAAQKIYVLHEAATAAQIALHPTSSLRLQGLLHRSVTIAGIQLGSDLAAETIAPLDRADLQTGLSQRLSVREATIPASNTALTCSTTGQQRTAVLLL